jgi:excisionase family DNA binding protein
MNYEECANVDIPTDGQLAYSVEDAADKLGIGRTTAFAEMRSGRLRSFRVNKRRLVPASALVEYIEDRMAEQSSAIEA